MPRTSPVSQPRPRAATMHSNVKVLAERFVVRFYDEHGTRIMRDQKLQASDFKRADKLGSSVVSTVNEASATKISHKVIRVTVR